MIIGYTAGVYDLFHIGHLTLLKNAKGLCDKLIVGVTTDELVLYKGKHSMIPYSDRAEIVRSIKYVDTVATQRITYVVPDIDDYAANRGFIYDNPEDYMGGHIVKTKEEFMQFIKDFAEGNDPYRDKRHWVCDQMYKYKDANSCERIVKLSEMSV